MLASTDHFRIQHELPERATRRLVAEFGDAHGQTLHERVLVPLARGRRLQLGTEPARQVVFTDRVAAALVAAQRGKQREHVLQQQSLGSAANGRPR